MRRNKGNLRTTATATAVEVERDWEYPVHGGRLTLPQIKTQVSIIVP
jgi:hypothetical protein